MQITSSKGVPHVVNHAYGLQCAVTNRQLNRACAVGRVDARLASEGIEGRTARIRASLEDVFVKIGSPAVGRLIDSLKQLRDMENSVLVVEHDASMMLSADRIIDMGPEPGHRGGEIVFNGTPRELLRRKRSVTPAHVGDGAPGRHREPARHARDDPEALDVLLFGSVAQQLHTEAYTEDRLLEAGQEQGRVLAAARETRHDLERLADLIRPLLGWRAKEAGDFSLQVTVTGEGMSDAIAREVTVFE